MKRKCFLVFFALCLFFPAALASIRCIAPPLACAGTVGRPPMLIYAPDPDFSEQTRKEHRHQSIALQLTVGANGVPIDIKVVRSISAELDVAAVAAVKKWKFEPAKDKDGHPVTITVTADIPIIPFVPDGASEDEPPPLPPPDNNLPTWLLESPVRLPSLHVGDQVQQVFRVGGRVKPPRAKYAPDPEYPKSARDDHYFGTVVLWLIVGGDGLPHDIKIARSVRPDLDISAVDAVKRWRFAPATKDNKPVSVQINVEVTYWPR